MRKFFVIFAAFVAFFSLMAQDNSNDLYQQYLNQYKKDQPAQAEQAKPAEAAPAQAETPAPAAQPAEEKKEEAPATQPAEEKKEEAPAAQSAEEKKEEAPAEGEAQPAAEPEKKEEAAAEGAAAEASGEEDGENKLSFERKPYFSIDTFGAMSLGVIVYGGDLDKDQSFRFGLDNAVVDMKGGDKMFNGRILFDLAKVREDGSLTFNVLKDVSFRMEHPSYRSGNNGFGLNVNLQAGLFGLPFGIEGGYDHEITFMNSAIKEEFLGGAFRDLAVSLGTDLIFNPKSDLAITLFVFNGRNETMLDGEDLFSAPAFGADIRFNYESDFYATAVASLVVGSAEHRYGGGFVDNIYDVVTNEDGEEELYYDVDGLLVSRSRSKQNVILAVGADLGYNINDNVSVGFKGEFSYSHRDLYNPEVTAANKLFLFDGIQIAGSSYNPYGFFVMPYASLWDFDVMARFSYYKAPYYENSVADRDNRNMEVDFSLIYNFCDYAGVEFDYIFNHWTEHGYMLQDKAEYTNTFNQHAFYLALTGWFDFLWEGKTDAAE